MEEKQQENFRLVLGIYLALMCLVLPLYMQNGYIGLGEAKFYLYRNFSLLTLVIVGGLFLWNRVLSHKDAEMGKIAPAPLDKDAEAGKIVSVSLGKDAEAGKIAPASSRKDAVTDWFLGLFLAGSIISWAAAYDRSTAFFGLAGWHMGLLTTLLMVAFYLLYRKFGLPFTRHQTILALLSGPTVAGVIGLLNRFSIISFGTEYETAFLSTIGNIDWLCGFLSVFLPLAVLTYVVSHNLKMRLLMVPIIAILLGLSVTQGALSIFISIGLSAWLSAILSTQKERMLRFPFLVFFFGAVCQVLRLLRYLGGGLFYFNDYYYYNESASGNALTTENGTLWVMLAGALLCAVAFAIRNRAFVESLLKGIRIAILGLTGLAFVALLALFVVVNVRGEGPAILPSKVTSLLLLSEDWGGARGAAFRATMDTYASFSPFRKLFGVGEDCYSVALYANAKALPSLIAYFSNATLRNAHNEGLTLLINGGIVGVVTYYGFLVGCLVRMAKHVKREPILYVWIGVVLSYVLHNMVSFGQIVSTPYIWIILGMGEWICQKQQSGSDSSAF